MQTLGGKIMHTNHNGQRLRLKSIKYIIDVEIMYVTNYNVFACCLIMSGLISQLVVVTIYGMHLLSISQK